MTLLIVVGIALVVLMVALLLVLSRRGSGPEPGTRRAPASSVADDPAFGLRDTGPGGGSV
jgi:hypothetical protein